MNEQQSLRQLFDLYADDLLAISYSYVKDWPIAEDLIQEVFLTYWNNPTAFRGESSIKTYLTRAAINRSKDYLKSWRYRTHYLTNEFFASYKQKKRLIEKEETFTIGRAIFQLPIEQREIIILYFYKQYTYKEIGELSQISETAVRKRMNKAKETLKKQLIQEEWEVLLHE